MIMAYREL